MEQNYTKLADLLVRHSVSLQKGEKVLIDNFRSAGKYDDCTCSCSS